MGKVLSNGTKVMFEGLDLTGFSTRWMGEISYKPLDPTTLESNAERTQAGIRADVFEWSGFFDDDGVNGPVEIGSALLGLAGKIVTGFVGTAVGGDAIGGTALLLQHGVPIERDELIRAELGFKPNEGTLGWGIHYGIGGSGTSGTAIGTTNGTVLSGSVDHSATTTAGGNFYCHITAGDHPTGSVDVQLMHAGAIGSTYVILGTLNDLATTGTVVSIPIGTGTAIRRATKVKFVTSGGSITFAAALVRYGTRE
jgi:hypothetical protein